jgi:cation/acetate symporter
MRGVGIVFSRFLEVDINTGVIIGMCIVFFYAVLGGMKGITYTQVAQYCVLIFAYMVPAIFISINLTGNPIPQLGMGGSLADGTYLLDKVDGLSAELGLAAYTEGKKSMIDIFCITAALMVGTAGLPHVIVRFFTVAKVKDARISAGYALVFIAILYTTAPALAVFGKYNLINAVGGKEGISYKDSPQWVKSWEKAGLIAWVDKNGDGKIQYAAGKALEGAVAFGTGTGSEGQREVTTKPTTDPNEIYVDNDIMVLANPEIAGLPNWVIALVAAGGLAAALSTAAGLLLVISSSVSHDLLKMNLMPDMSEKSELLAARISAAFAIVLAGYFGIYPPGFVASVVAFAFGLAASSFFPVIIMGIFSKRMNMQGAVAGMIVGLVFTLAYIIYFKFGDVLFGFPKEAIANDKFLFGISPEGIGTIGMILNFIISYVVSSVTPPPPQEVQDMVESIRFPRGAGDATH